MMSKQRINNILYNGIMCNCKCDSSATHRITDDVTVLSNCLWKHPKCYYYINQILKYFHSKFTVQIIRKQKGFIPLIAHGPVRLSGQPDHGNKIFSVVLGRFILYHDPVNERIIPSHRKSVTQGPFHLTYGSLCVLL